MACHLYYDRIEGRSTSPLPNLKKKESIMENMMNSRMIPNIHISVALAMAGISEFSLREDETGLTLIVDREKYPHIGEVLATLLVYSGYDSQEHTLQ